MRWKISYSPLELQSSDTDQSKQVVQVTEGWLSCRFQLSKKSRAQHYQRSYPSRTVRIDRHRTFTLTLASIEGTRVNDKCKNEYGLARDFYFYTLMFLLVESQCTTLPCSYVFHRRLTEECKIWLIPLSVKIPSIIARVLYTCLLSVACELLIVRDC